MLSHASSTGKNLVSSLSAVMRPHCIQIYCCQICIDMACVTAIGMSITSDSDRGDVQWNLSIKDSEIRTLQLRMLNCVKLSCRYVMPNCRDCYMHEELVNQ